DQLLLQARQRPVLDRLRCCKRAEKVAKIVGERMKLEPHGVGRERSARQPCPLDRALAFLDPLFARPALIVEGDDPLGWAGHVGDDETDARIKLAVMPFDFGDHPARSSRLATTAKQRSRSDLPASLRHPGRSNSLALASAHTEGQVVFDRGAAWIREVAGHNI